jgi:ferrochelatase
MAYGSPATEHDIEAYFTHIRGGRKPSPEALAHLVQRYRAIGSSPLARITRGQAAALGERLDLPTFVGMKHAPPFIADAVEDARRAGIERLVSLPLAPHYARMSFRGYEAPLREAWKGELITVQGFHTNLAFVTAVQELLREALRDFEPERIFFTAHSLPARIAAEGDDYPGRLLESCRLVAASMDIPKWRFAFQSASTTGEPWFGPDLLADIEESRVRSALVCPIGFVADHLEILYDLDVEAKAWAREHGVDLRRTASFNDRPSFIAALEGVVREAIAERINA